MRSNLDNLDDREYYARRAKRKKRMMIERKRRMRRRMIIRLCICLIPLLVIVISISAAISAHREKKELERQQAEALETTVVQEEIAEEEPAEELPVYEFISNEDTKSIYSENVISSHAILVAESTDMTKVLTLLVAAEHVTEEQMDDTFTMTIDITDYSYVNDCSNVGFVVDEKIPVKDLFYGTILPSGGDAAVGLATYVAGSHEAFVELMNEKLEELGLSDTAHFTNCVGLYDENHYCTLYDMAIIMKAAMENEFCREVLSTKCYTTTPTTEHPEGIIISNWFLRRIEDKDTDGEVIGAKTGFVAQSGSCAVSYQMAENGTPYICATAGSTSSWRCIYDHVEIYTNYVPGIE